MIPHDKHKEERENGTSCSMVNCFYFDAKSEQKCGSEILGETAVSKCTEFYPENKWKQSIG